MTKHRQENCSCEQTETFIVVTMLKILSLCAWDFDYPNQLAATSSTFLLERIGNQIKSDVK